MQEDSSNNNAAASPVEVWDGQAQGSEPRGGDGAAAGERFCSGDRRADG